MIRQTHDEWWAEAHKRFEHREDVAFQCPACKHIATLRDFKDAGLDPEDAATNCIGRLTGKGVDFFKVGKDKGDGCNWCAYGLFGTLNGGRVVVMPDGKEILVFDFGPATKEVPASADHC